MERTSYILTTLIPRNRFRQTGNRFLGSLKGLQIRALVLYHSIGISKVEMRGGVGGEDCLLFYLSNSHWFDTDTPYLVQYIKTGMADEDLG